MSARPAIAATATREAAPARQASVVRAPAARHAGQPDAGQANFQPAGNLAAQPRVRPATQASPGSGAVQLKCAACAAGGAPCPKCEEEARQPVQQMRAGDGATVQLWDCSEFGEPTCVQTKPAEPPPVQARCAACEQPQEQPQEQHGQAGKQAPVQRDGDAGVPPEAIQREAGKGLSSATAPLPHAERIQAAFGHHDLSDVRAAVGGPAATASRRMGALAFASGNRIGFRESPGLHLAAHEAAHVVQQRSGLRLPGNVGRPGDPWERHADDVADAVVRGRSAQPLLDKVARPGKAAEGHGGLGANARTGPVQHRLTTPPTRSMEPPAAPPQVPGERAGSKEGKGAGAKGGAAPAGGETGSALEAAGGDTEAPPEGVTTGATGSPGAGGGAAGAPPGAAARPAAPASGGALNAPCYNVDPPPRPSKTKKPKSDNDKNEAKGEERVTFDAWQDLPDVCPAEAAMAQAGGPAAGAPAAGAPPPAEAAGAAGPEGAKGTAGASGKAKGGGGGGGAGAGEGAPAAEGAPAGGLDSEIGQAEGQRDTAIGDYEQAAAALETVQAGTGQLRSGLVFAGGGPQTEGARDKAIGRTGAFLDAAAGQIASAAAFGLQRLPGRLGSLADSINANTAAAIDLEKAAISERIMGARARSMGAAQAARAHVLAEHAASVATVEAETDAALATLDDEYGTALEQTDEKETGGLADVNGRFAAGRRSHEQKGPQYAGRAVRRGQEHVRQYERCKTHPKTGVAYDDDGFWDGCLTVRRARAQQDVACKTAGSYRNAFLRTANKKGYDLIELRKVYRCAVIAGARQVNQTLDDLYDRLTSGLESARTQAIKGLGMARDQNMAAIDAALAGSLGGLAAQEAAQRQAAADTGYLKQLAVEQLAHSGAANLVRGVSAASASLQQVLGTVRDRLAAGGVPDPDWLTLTLGTLQSALGGGMETLLGKMEEGAQGAERTLVELGMASLAALQKVTEGNDALAAQAEAGFTAQMQGLMAGATSAFGQLTGSLVEQAQDGAAQGTEAMQAAVTGFATALGTIGGKVTAAVAASLAELVKDLDGKIAELDEQIASEAWKAASKEQPAWKKVVAIVLIILVIIAAAVISIVTLGAGASLFAVILVGALVGAASAGLIQILNNWSSGEAWDEGLVTAMVMGAIGGAIGGGLGFAGGALAAGAGAAGARVATQLAIQVGADLAAEGITQTVGYFAFGQEFNWQGFLMAGTMSSVGFRATPAKPHVPVPHPPAPRAGGAPHGPAAPHAGGPHPAAPDAPRPHAPEPAPPRPGEAPATRPGDAPPARPGEAAPARPADAAAPGPGTAGAAAGRRAAVAQVAGGAVLGFAVEGIGAWLSGQKFDMTRAASAAAGGAVSARAARMGHGSAPREAPDTRLGRAGDRLRQFDPGDAGARLGKRLEDAGGRLFGRPEVDAPSGGMAPARPRTDEALPSGAKVDEPAPAPRPADTGEGPAAPPRRPDTADDPAAPRAADAGEGPARPPRGTGEAVPEGPPTRDRSAAELAETTHAPVRVGNEDHDVYFTRRNGHVECDICSFGCGSIKSNLRHMQAALPDTPDGVRLRDQLQEIHTRVVEVEAGIEGATIPHRDVIAASAGIADSLHALGMAEPRLGAAIDNPNVFQRVYDPADVDTAGRPRVRTDDLGGETAPRTSAPIGKVPELKLPNGTPLPEGTPLLYVLRDKETGAVLKVGETAVGTAAEARFERYRFAAEELDVRAVIEITPVTDLRGRKITDYESDLRARMEAAGHIMPWDYTRVEGSGGMGRLGRAGPGTPFESLPGSATSKLRRDKWDWERGDTPRKGYLLPPGEGSGTAPVRGKIQLDELVGMLREGRTTKQIADHFGVPEPSVRRAKSNWRRILAERLK